MSFQYGYQSYFKSPNKDHDQFYAAFQDIRSTNKNSAHIKESIDNKKGTMRNLLSYNYAPEFKDQVSAYNI